MAHTSPQDLGKKLQNAQETIEIGSVYCHYKKPLQLYRVIAVGLIEESEEPCVVYQSLYGENLVWVRALSSWLEKVTQDNGQVQRFQRALP